MPEWLPVSSAWVLSGKLKVDGYTRTAALFTVQPCGCQDTIENFRVVARRAPSQRPALRGGVKAHNGCMGAHKRGGHVCFVCWVFVTLVCDVHSPVSPPHGLFSHSPWCSSNSIVIKGTRTRAQDGSECIYSIWQGWKIFCSKMSRTRGVVKNTWGGEDRQMIWCGQKHHFKKKSSKILKLIARPSGGGRGFANWLPSGRVKLCCN